ncbi:hypothetical protein EVAR_67034_1 [Eumeta japonica]|uniref:Uncharacterized protein n=1 Tax=Eumeta variegata TaxID=151549 RepID=A0A4C2A1V5_EUMVA|nr:hypothetical protein EVAR_67034_1 [Eumeta japonica]
MFKFSATPRPRAAWLCGFGAACGPVEGAGLALLRRQPQTNFKVQKIFYMYSKKKLAKYFMKSLLNRRRKSSRAVAAASRECRE